MFMPSNLHCILKWNYFCYIDLFFEKPADLLTVDIISNGTEGVAPATFEFEAKVTGGAEPYSISWNFNDSREESEEQTVLHTFDESGTYNVTITITDSEGQTASESIEITIKERPRAEESVLDSSYPICVYHLRHQI